MSFKTPQRVQHLSVNNFLGSGRMSISGRKSSIGLKGSRDSRQLSDKSWQRKAVSEILQFLQNNDYPKVNISTI